MMLVGKPTLSDVHRANSGAAGFFLLAAVLWWTLILLRAKAATALASLSHRNSVCSSARHMGGSVKKRCKRRSPYLYRWLPGRL